MNFLKHILTGKDGVSYDLVRALALLSVLVGLGLECWSVVHGKPFDMLAFGLGLGAVFAAVGAALKLKESTEP